MIPLPPPQAKPVPLRSDTRGGMTRERIAADPCARGRWTLVRVVWRFAELSGCPETMDFVHRVEERR